MGFTVDPQSGATRALSKDVEQGLVGDDLSADGTTILAHTGGPNPAAAHDVVTVPYAKRGKLTVLAHRAAVPALEPVSGQARRPARSKVCSRVSSAQGRGGALRVTCSAGRCYRARQP